MQGGRGNKGLGQEGVRIVVRLSSENFKAGGCADLLLPVVLEGTWGPRWRRLARERRKLVAR